MATQTLVEAAKLINNQIVRGVAEDIITVNPLFNFLPFSDYTGQAIVVNRENALGDAGNYDVGDQITSKTAATFTQATYTAVSLIGDVEMNGLVQAQSASAGVDQMAIEISSKAKNIGRQFQSGMATGTGTAPQMNSLHSMVDSAQYTSPSAGQALSFNLLRELLDLVLSKDGEVDFIMMHSRTLRAYAALCDQLGGTPPMQVISMPDGTTREVRKFEDVPIFKNDYLSITETANGAATTGGNLTSVWAGCFDDGSRKVGISGIYPSGTSAGVQIKNVGYKEDYDESLVRVVMYTNFVNFNRKGLARLPSINN
jgi:hypothetical protein